MADVATTHSEHSSQKERVSDICRSFVHAQGNLERRQKIKNQLKEICDRLSLSWEKVCQCFREVVRVFETRKRAELECRPMFCFTEGV